MSLDAAQEKTPEQTIMPRQLGVCGMTTMTLRILFYLIQ